MKFLTHESKISCIDDNGKEVGNADDNAIVGLIGKKPKVD